MRIWGALVDLAFWVWHYVIKLWRMGPPDPPEPPPVPHLIPDDPSFAPTGPNLVSNPSFELGNPDPGMYTDFTSSGVVSRWIVIQNGGLGRWVASGGSDGSRYVDLTGGRPPGPGRTASSLLQDNAPALQTGQSYECSLDLGVGPDNGPLDDQSGPIEVSVKIMYDHPVEQSFVYNPAPPAFGVLWQRFAFRFEIPAGFTQPPNTNVNITNGQGKRLIAVDNVSLRAIAPV